MNEFIIPMAHNGDPGIYVCAGFECLNGEQYDRLALSIDGVTYKETSVDENNVSSSLPVSFPVEKADVIYVVYGLIEQGNRKKTTATRIVSSLRSSNDREASDGTAKEMRREIGGGRPHNIPRPTSVRW